MAPNRFYWNIWTVTHLLNYRHVLCSCLLKEVFHYKTSSQISTMRQSIFNVQLGSVISLLHHFLSLHLSSSGHNGEEKHRHRHAVLDGSGGHTGDRLQLRGWHLVSRDNSYRDVGGEAALRRHTSHEGERVCTVSLCLCLKVRGESVCKQKVAVYLCV